jgi:hypothetical protein
VGLVAELEMRSAKANTAPLPAVFRKQKTGVKKYHIGKTSQVKKDRFTKNFSNVDKDCYSHVKFMLTPQFLLPS